MMEQEINYESVELTADLFERAASSNGGFSYEQLALFGIDLPPKKGWKKILLGKLASREIVEEFIALKDKHLAQTRRIAARQLPHFVSIDFPLPWREQYKHPNWQKMRLYILNRDNFTCQRCGSNHRLLHVHHTAYSRNGFIWDVDPATLKTLCEVCHSREHKQGPT
jgi:hypothetical protein